MDRYTRFFCFVKVSLNDETFVQSVRFDTDDDGLLVL